VGKTQEEAPPSPPQATIPEETSAVAPEAAC